MQARPCVVLQRLRYRKHAAVKLPSTLLARTNAVLGVSAAAIALTSITALMVFVIRPIEDRSADDEAGLVVLSAQTWVELPPEARHFFEIELLEEHDLVITSAVRQLPLVAPGQRYFELLEEKLSGRLGEPMRLMESDDLLWANVPMGSYVLQVGFSPERQDVQPLYVGFVIVLVGAIIVAGTSALIVRRVASPLSDAASAVESFRGAEGFQPLPEQGPAELVTLAASFNAMARDISELLSNRTTLLAGISHDLRTPLTRMRFALELLPDTVPTDLIDRFERNLTAMDELITDALRFARGAGEEPRRVPFRDYLDGVVARIDDELRIEWRGALPNDVNIATGAFQRVLANLVNNAQQHGGGAKVAVDCGPTLVVHVTDAGPGIPPSERDKVFRPFYRLEESRARATGGSGLGLAIVHQLCQAHGWRVSLDNSQDGGTDASIEVPTFA